ncbi:hypothetical protein RRJ83_000431 [Vibrio parahaemolyticus]|nr:hypothetical protein [Vibrio parahaemolyticus]
MQKLLEIVVWVSFGVCVAVTTYNVLEKESLNNRITEIQTTQSVIQEQQNEMLNILDQCLTPAICSR